MNYTHNQYLYGHSDYTLDITEQCPKCGEWWNGEPPRDNPFYLIYHCMNPDCGYTIECYDDDEPCVLAESLLDLE